MNSASFWFSKKVAEEPMPNVSYIEDGMVVWGKVIPASFTSQNIALIQSNKVKNKLKWEEVITIEKNNFNNVYLCLEGFNLKDKTNIVFKNLKIIAEDCFQQAGGVENISLSGDNEYPMVSVGRNCFNNCPTLKRVSGNVKTLYGGTFSHCSNLSDVLLPFLYEMKGVSNISFLPRLLLGYYPKLQYINHPQFQGNTILTSLTVSSRMSNSDVNTVKNTVQGSGCRVYQV